MQPKGCECLGCWTQVVTLNFDLTHDLDLGFSGENFDSHILGMGRSIDSEWKRCEFDTMLDVQWACMANTSAKRWVNIELVQFPTCWPMNGLFVHWSRGWGVLSFSERLLHNVPVIISSWNFQELLLTADVMSAQNIKVRGQRSRSQGSKPNFRTPVWIHI